MSEKVQPSEKKMLDLMRRQMGSGETIFTQPFRCASFQPTCSQQQNHYLLQYVPEARKGEEESLRSKNHPNWTRLFLTLGLFHHWRNGSSSSDSVQEIGRHDRREERTRLQPNAQVAEMQTELCPPQVFHHVSQRDQIKVCPLHTWWCLTPMWYCRNVGSVLSPKSGFLIYS